MPLGSIDFAPDVLRGLDQNVGIPWISSDILEHTEGPRSVSPPKALAERLGCVWCRHLIEFQKLCLVHVLVVGDLRWFAVPLVVSKWQGVPMLSRLSQTSLPTLMQSVCPHIRSTLPYRDRVRSHASLTVWSNHLASLGVVRDDEWADTTTLGDHVLLAEGSVRLSRLLMLLSTKSRSSSVICVSGVATRVWWCRLPCVGPSESQRMVDRHRQRK